MPFQHPPIPIRKLRPGFLIATGMSTFFRLAKYGNCKNTESKFISVFNVIKEKNGNKNRNSLVQSRRKRKNEFRFSVFLSSGKTGNENGSSNSVFRWFGPKTNIGVGIPFSYIAGKRLTLRDTLNGPSSHFILQLSISLNFNIPSYLQVNF